MPTIDRRKKELAFVVYPGVSPLDVVETMGILKGLATRGPYRTTVVGERTEAIESDTPLKIVPARSFAELPHPYGLFVMGGSGVATLYAMGNEALLAYVRSASASAELVGSTSTGALLLAAAGLLAGRQATTHWAYAGILENLGATYVPKRWVEDGKFITAAGGTAGLDMALALTAKLAGVGKARFAQLHVEYDPEPPFRIDWSRVDREALAPILAEHEASLKQALAARPDLLGAVLGRPHEAAPR